MVKCCDIHSGMLKTVVAFQRAADTADGAGGRTRVWGAIAGTPTRAHVTHSSGQERFRSDRTESAEVLRATVRYSASIQEGDGVLVRGKRYNVRFIDNIELRNRWLRLTLEGGVAV